MMSVFLTVGSSCPTALYIRIICALGCPSGVLMTAILSPRSCQNDTFSSLSAPRVEVTNAKKFLCSFSVFSRDFLVSSSHSTVGILASDEAILMNSYSLYLRSIEIIYSSIGSVINMTSRFLLLAL